MRAEADTHAEQAVLEAENRMRRAEEARVASLGEDMHRLSLVMDGLKAERNQVVSGIFEGLEGKSQLSGRIYRGYICERSSAPRN